MLECYLLVSCPVLVVSIIDSNNVARIRNSDPIWPTDGWKLKLFNSDLSETLVEK